MHIIFSFQGEIAWLVKGEQRLWSHLRHVAHHGTSWITVNILVRSPDCKTVCDLRRGVQPPESCSTWNWSLYYLVVLALIWHLPHIFELVNIIQWVKCKHKYNLFSQVAHIFRKTQKCKCLCFYDMDLNISLCHKPFCLIVLGSTMVSPAFALSD